MSFAIILTTSYSKLIGESDGIFRISRILQKRLQNELP